MNKEKVKLESLKLIGLTARTKNKDEMTPDKGKIGPLANHYWSNQTGNGFKCRTNSGVTYCVYTDFESDEHGEYTYFIG
jgi:predicted transcriptional regulator YdeE